MKIGIDGRALQGNKTGVGRYVFELCKALDSELPEADFFIYSQVPIEMPIDSKRWVNRVEPAKWALKLKSTLWLKIRCGILCKQDNLDVFWGSASFFPNLVSTVRKVITVYDLNYKLTPETMHTPHLWAYRLFFKRDVECADSIVAISKGTSERLLSLIGRSADTIVYPAVDASFIPQTKETIEEVLSLYNIPYPYLLAVATWEPRKNLELLISTFIDMQNHGMLLEYKLVLVGGRGWKDQRLAELLIGKNSVEPLGYVSDRVLASLYSGAAAFIFPSIYEGFGMPVLEARACGAIVVTSDIPELREAGENDAIYIEPSADGIEKGIIEALSIPHRPTSEYPSITWRQEAKKLAKVLIKAQPSSGLS